MELETEDTLALIFVGIAVLIGALAMSHQHQRAFSASVFYVALGALAAVGLSVLGVRPLSPGSDRLHSPDRASRTPD